MNNALCGLCVMTWAAVMCAQQADLVFRSGRIWTGNPAQPWAEAVAIRGDQISAVGKAGMQGAGPGQRRKFWISGKSSPCPGSTTRISTFSAGR